MTNPYNRSLNKRQSGVFIGQMEALEGITAAVSLSPCTKSNTPGPSITTWERNKITNIYIDRRSIIKDERFSNSKRVPFINAKCAHGKKSWGRPYQAPVGKSAPSSNLEEKTSGTEKFSVERISNSLDKKETYMLRYVHAPYSTDHRSNFAIHELAGAIDLQLRYDTIGLEVRDQEIGPLGKPALRCRSNKCTFRDSLRPQHRMSRFELAQLSIPNFTRSFAKASRFQNMSAGAYLI